MLNSQFKQHNQSLFTFSDILACNITNWYPETSSIRMLDYCLSKHCLSYARWTIQKYRLPRFYITHLEQMWGFNWNHKCHTNAFFRVIATSDVVEWNVRLVLKNAFQQTLLNFCVVISTEFFVHVEAYLVAWMGFILEGSRCKNRSRDELSCFFLFWSYWLRCKCWT
jgi:hypothetical protein